MKFLLPLLCLFSFITAPAQTEHLSFETVEIPPLHSECTSGTVAENRQCTQQAIESFAKQKFNAGLFKNLNLNEKRIRVYAQFTIDKTGKATNIKVRTAHPQLEKETKRVLNLLPRLTPAKHDGKPVVTQFNLPLIFILG